MMGLFERYGKISWSFVFIIAIAIFYISSLTFPPGKVGFGWKTIAYHFLVFFFLSLFLLPALVKGKNKKLIFIAIILAVLYGVSDEIHQFFVPGRHCSFSDIIVNSCGILFSGLIYTLSLKFRNLSGFQNLPKNTPKYNRKNKIKPNPR